MSVALEQVSAAQARSPRKCRSILYLDTAYTVSACQSLLRNQFYASRHADGYFERVWGVHLIADVAGKDTNVVETIEWSDRQTIIEGVSAELGLPHFLLPFDFLISQGRLIQKLARLVRDRKIDVIAATDNYYNGLVAVILKALTRRPLIIYVFGNPDELYEATGTLMMPRLLRFRKVESLVARLVLSRADLVVAQNANNLSFARANGARGESVIIPAAKHVEREHLAPPDERDPPETFVRLGIEAGRPVLLYVGRLLPLKHPDSAVRAMARVVTKRPDAVGLLAGDGPMRGVLERLIAELGVSDRVHLLGSIDQLELVRLIPHTITLSPLTGMALVECALGGSPIVAFDRDWQAEFVVDGTTGFVVPFLDDAAMAERCMIIIDDAELQGEMRQASRASALRLSDPSTYRELEHSAFDRLFGD